MGRHLSSLALAAATSTALAALLIPAAATAASEVEPGTYEGKRAGLTAQISVAESGAGMLRYAVRTRCGRSRGTLRLATTRAGRLKGRRSRAGAVIVARIRPAGPGRLAGSIRLKPVAGGSKCGARRTFEARLEGAPSADPEALVGRYEGRGQQGGHPVSFDVVRGGGSGALSISGFAFATGMECWDDLDGDGADDTLVGRFNGLAGAVARGGGFEIAHTPDEDTEVYVSGEIAGGTATMSIEVGGFFAPDGTSQPGGPFECDSWGETYVATKR